MNSWPGSRGLPRSILINPRNFRKAASRFCGCSKSAYWKSPAWMPSRCSPQQGNPRKKVLIPDSAHGTNPATAVIAGYEVENIKSESHGQIDVDKLRDLVTEDVAALMITNPSTLGIFEERIPEIAEILHATGALLYMDGANMNALTGVTRPGDLGVDVMHLNLHKTFSTPHGGGGPGAGPVAMKKILEPFKPVPVLVEKEGGKLALDSRRPH